MDPYPNSPDANTFAQRLAKIEDEFEAALNKLAKKLDETGPGIVEDSGTRQFREVCEQMARAVEPAAKDAKEAKTDAKASKAEEGDRIGQIIADHIARVLDRKIPYFGAARQTFDLARLGVFGEGAQRAARGARVALMRSRVGQFARSGLRKLGGQLAGTAMGKKLGVAGKRAAGGGAGRAAGAVAGGGARAAAGAAGLGAAAGPGLVVAGAVLATAALIKFSRQTDAGTRALEEQAKGLAEVSALTALFVKQAEVQDIFRQRDLGDRTANSLQFMLRSAQDRRDNQRELDVAKRRLDHWMQGLQEKIVSTYSGPFNHLLGKWNKVADKLLGADADGGSMTSWEMMEEGAKRQEERDKKNQAERERLAREERGR